MSIKHLDLEIEEELPFKNCKLGREKYAGILTNIIDNYPDGFVLAINNKWGTGKTTFVKMWEQNLKNIGFKTIYFNAWENDFEDNPLTALIGELKIVNKKADDKFNKVVRNAAQLSKNIAPAVLKAILNKYVDSDVLVQTFSESTKTMTEIFEQDVKEYAERKRSIIDFRNSLSEYVATESNGKPLVFIIDELDRCRPNYSVSLLEQVKHFFSVPNIVFVLSIDKIQLGNAICGVYGSEKLDANEYLKRFIDIEYSIPEPDKGVFFDYLYQYFDFDSFFNSIERNKYREFSYDKDNFLFICKLLLANLSLRQQEKILSHTRITLRTLNYNNYLIPVFYGFLIYLKNIHEDLYHNLVNKNISLTQSQNDFYEIIKPYLNNDNEYYFIEIEALLLVYYQNYISGFRGNNDIYERISGEYKLNIESKINNDLLLSYYTRFNRDYFNLGLDYFIKKLELADDIKIS